MTEHIAALDALIEAVTDGVLPNEDWRLMHDIWSPRNWHDIGHNVRYSMHGSLDAAKALHEALLPGWMWLVRATDDADHDCRRCDETCNGFANVWGGVCPNEGGVHFDVFAETPARAWLLAILKAYRAGL